jgi:hypothetical protein
MTEHDPTSEAAKTGSGEKPSLFDRLALCSASADVNRDDIADALGLSIQDDISRKARVVKTSSPCGSAVGDVMVPAPTSSPRRFKPSSPMCGISHRRPFAPARARETLDDPRGMVHIRDFVAYSPPPRPPASEERAAGSPEPEGEAGAAAGRAAADMSIAGQYSAPGSVHPASMPALDLLVKMQAT